MAVTVCRQTYRLPTRPSRDPGASTSVTPATSRRDWATRKALRLACVFASERIAAEPTRIAARPSARITKATRGLPAAQSRVLRDVWRRWHGLASKRRPSSVQLGFAGKPVHGERASSLRASARSRRRWIGRRVKAHSADIGPHARSRRSSSRLVMPFGKRMHGSWQAELQPVGVDAERPSPRYLPSLAPAPIAALRRPHEQ